MDIFALTCTFFFSKFTVQTGFKQVSLLCANEASVHFYDIYSVGVGFYVTTVAEQKVQSKFKDNRNMFYLIFPSGLLTLHPGCHGVNEDQ